MFYIWMLYATVWFSIMPSRIVFRRLHLLLRHLLLIWGAKTWAERSQCALCVWVVAGERVVLFGLSIEAIGKQTQTSTNMHPRHSYIYSLRHTSLRIAHAHVAWFCDGTRAPKYLMSSQLAEHYTFSIPSTNSQSRSTVAAWLTNRSVCSASR